MIRKMPIIIPTRSGFTMTIMPKIMHKMARTGLEIVIPIFSVLSQQFLSNCVHLFTCICNCIDNHQYLRYSITMQVMTIFKRLDAIKTTRG